MSLLERFWKKVLKGPGCWEWKASTDTYGYGQIGVEGKLRLAHRLAWELTHGPIPEGKCVLHECDNPKCVNPEHLFLGSQRDNILDMVKKGRNANASAKLSPEKADEIRRRQASGEAQKDLAVAYGVSRPTISNIVNGKSYVPQSI